jgi:hypothetical protein
MRFFHRVFPLSHFIISLLFIGGALALIVFAALALWQGTQPTGGWSAPPANRCRAHRAAAPQCSPIDRAFLGRFFCRPGVLRSNASQG